MISTIFKKRELRLKETILKGVYEENLKIVGKEPERALSRLPLNLRKMFLSSFLVLLFILGYGNPLNLSLFQDKQTIAHMNIQKSVSQPFNTSFIEPDFSVNPLDFKSFLNIPGTPLSRTFGLTVKTVMLDPGHGGSDTGTVGRMGTKEKDITLDIAKRLKERLEKHGKYNVIMTREQDITLPLNKRIEIARLNKADIFVSIHINSLPSNPINIIETYFFGPSSDEKILKLAEHENAGSQYGMSDFKKIIEKISNTLKFQESKILAASIQKSLFLNIRKENRNVQNFGIKMAPFLVLLGVDVPAVLTEVSCLSNNKEEIELNKEPHRENIAFYLESGILDYLNKGEIRYEAKR
jgi:N-acetylmuramoyl-L-alanine amidase